MNLFPNYGYKIYGICLSQGFVQNNKRWFLDFDFGKWTIRFFFGSIK